LSNNIRLVKIVNNPQNSPKINRMHFQVRVLVGQRHGKSAEKLGGQHASHVRLVVDKLGIARIDQGVVFYGPVSAQEA